MSNSTPDGYERDILEQPAALERCAVAPLPRGITALDLGKFDRIVLTGMGSSDSATIPLELSLARRGLPVWRLQTGRLLETPEMITSRTLLWITSQSGRSGEVVALMERLPNEGRPTVVAVTDAPASPLGRGADHVVELLSGEEATVSAKSFLNTLAWLRRVEVAFAGGSDAATVAEIRGSARSLQAWLEAPPRAAAELARRALAGPDARFALVGTGPDAAIALTGALILKEASKVAAEGYIGGAFRHGPLELAGPGLTALLIGTGAEQNVTLDRLARDLGSTRSLVATVGSEAYPGTEHLAVPDAPPFARMAHAMAIVQQFSVHLARAAGHTPGAFRFGHKVTASL